MTYSSVAPGDLEAGVTKSGTSIGETLNILGHIYWPKEICESSYAFQTVDPPHTGIPPHIHAHQDEFIHVLEGTFTLYLDGEWTTADVGDVVRMPKGLAHAYYNRTDSDCRAMFWVAPTGRLPELFGKLHNLKDQELVLRYSSECDVEFLPPGSVEGA